MFLGICFPNLNSVQYNSKCIWFFSQAFTRCSLLSINMPFYLFTVEDWIWKINSSASSYILSVVIYIISASMGGDEVMVQDHIVLKVILTYFLSRLHINHIYITYGMYSNLLVSKRLCWFKCNQKQPYYLFSPSLGGSWFHNEKWKHTFWVTILKVITSKFMQNIPIAFMDPKSPVFQMDATLSVYYTYIWWIRLFLLKKDFMHHHSYSSYIAFQFQEAFHFPKCVLL